jgi:DNA-binding response OmpR family regulator
VAIAEVENLDLPGTRAPKERFSDDSPHFNQLSSVILLVEDEPHVVAAIRSGLPAHRITPVGNGFDALEIVTKANFDLVLLDLRLPGIDGFEVLRRLKASPETLNIPVVVLTAQGDVDEKVRAFDLGAHDYITKPFSLAELKARIAAATRAKRAYDSLLARTLKYDAARDAAEDAALFKR